MKARRSVCLFLGAWGSVGIAVAAERGGTLDWNALGNDAVDLLSRYVQVDTTNPPGNEIKAAQFLKAVFDKEGIENQVFESAPGRASLYARLEGDGTKQAVVLLNHLDVVPVDRRYWTQDPFGGAIKDGYIWGRGTIDMKGMGVVEAMSMLALKRQGVLLKGDIVFLGVADEEDGGAMGAGYIVREHPELLKAAGLVINEGGSIITADDGKVLYYGIDTAEKSPLWLKLTATGTPGHGSLPRSDSAASRLVRALDRVVNYQTPLKVVPDVQRYYADIAGLRPSLDKERLKDLRSSLQDPSFAAQFTSDLFSNAQVRNTIALTVMEASNKTNVISPEASAQLDVRLLPGEDPHAVLMEVRKIIADDSIKVEIMQTFVAGSSPTDSELFRVVSAIAGERNPGVPVTSLLLYSFTDCHFFRDHGIPCYGFMPFRLSAKELSLIHGNNERISVENVKDGARLMYLIVSELAAQ
jgi:acetylornithine deacetylase/succinyl-diaminopimelate desuccinylase-like protein